MSFRALRTALRERLDEGRDGAHGWWLITRVHLDASRLQSITSFLYDAGAEGELELRTAHYRGLATILGIENAAPWVTINRHYFLAMETPLRLMQRVDGTHWTRIQLTPAGVRLATEDNAVGVFEAVLNDIRFCRTPWFTPTRVNEYADFDVRPYPAALTVMRQSDGYIDLDEFDLFASRIRRQAEIRLATASIEEFRTLNETQKAELRYEVERRIRREAGRDARKPYSNWRDMARHTFSLFSLGESAQRSGNELLLSRTLVSEDQAPQTVHRRAAVNIRAVTATPRRSRSELTLRIPYTEAPPELLTPRFFHKRIPEVTLNFSLGNS